MLKVLFNAETDNDTISPINIANALIDSEMCYTNDEKDRMWARRRLREIAAHIRVYLDNTTED